MQSEDDFVLTLQSKPPAEIIEAVNILLNKIMKSIFVWYRLYRNEARSLQAKDSHGTITNEEIKRLGTIHPYLDWLKWYICSLSTLSPSL